MNIKATYYPEGNERLHVDHNYYQGYYNDSVVLVLPVDVMLEGANLAYVVTSSIFVKTVNPLPNLFVGEGSIWNTTQLQGEIKSGTQFAQVEIMVHVPYHRLEMLETYRQQLSTEPRDIRMMFKEISCF